MVTVDPMKLQDVAVSVRNLANDFNEAMQANSQGMTTIAPAGSDEASAVAANAARGFGQQLMASGECVRDEIERLAEALEIAVNMYKNEDISGASLFET